MNRKKRVRENGEEIYVLSLENCPYCSVLKNSLLRLKIPFQDVNIDKNARLGDKIEIEYQTEGLYPVIMVGNDVLLPHTNLVPSDSLRIFQTIDEALPLIKDKYYEI